MSDFPVYFRALVRVVRAHWMARHWRDDDAGPLHLVPLDKSNEDERVPGLACTERPSLCGVYVVNPGNATVQPLIVTCWRCAVAYERGDVPRVPPRRQRGAQKIHVRGRPLTPPAAPGATR